MTREGARPCPTRFYLRRKAGARGGSTVGVGARSFRIATPDPAGARLLYALGGPVGSPRKPGAARANRLDSTHRHEGREAIRRVRDALLSGAAALPGWSEAGSRAGRGQNSRPWPGFRARGGLRSVHERRAHHPVGSRAPHRDRAGRYAPVARDRRRPAAGELLYREPRSRGGDGGGAPPRARRERGSPPAVGGSSSRGMKRAPPAGAGLLGGPGLPAGLPGDATRPGRSRRRPPPRAARRRTASRAAS